VTERPSTSSRLPPIDHLVWGGHLLDAEIDRFEAWTGVRAAPGGRHPREGTHNALIALGPDTYLELITPDPGATPPARPRWFGLDALESPRLVAWAAKTDDLDTRAAAARAHGVELGEVGEGRRERSSGDTLAWRLTYPVSQGGVGLVPFLIDWGDGRHPAAGAPTGVRLIELRAEHPEPASIRARLEQLGIELEVTAGVAPALVATLHTPRGEVTLR
jgi:hypothetical protein